MCLIVFAYECHPEYRLILAANRDEYYDRPTALAGFWPDHSQVLAGRDLARLGTWLGITTAGRFAALTNYRDPARYKKEALSRGELVSAYLTGSLSPGEYLTQAAGNSVLYNGYNLLAGDGSSLWYHAGVTGEIHKLKPGIYGLSNHLLDTPWPKVARSKEKMTECTAKTGPEMWECLHSLLADKTPAADSDLPQTGIGMEWERLLSPAFITAPGYGTRSSAILTINRRQQVHFSERTFSSGVSGWQDAVFDFTISDKKAD